MSVKMQPTSVIKAHLGINPGGRVQKVFTTTCRKAMDKYVPYDTGDLRTIVTVADNSITYEMPYARYQYYGMWEDGSHKVNNYTTPGTGTYWDKRMWSAEGQNVVQEVQDYVDRGR
jgi:hypothetical protein